MPTRKAEGSSAYFSLRNSYPGSDTFSDFSFLAKARVDEAAAAREETEKAGPEAKASEGSGPARREAAASSRAPVAATSLAERRMLCYVSFGCGCAVAAADIINT